MTGLGQVVSRCKSNSSVAFYVTYNIYTSGRIRPQWPTLDRKPRTTSAVRGVLRVFRAGFAVFYGK